MASSTIHILQSERLLEGKFIATSFLLKGCSSLFAALDNARDPTSRNGVLRLALLSFDHHDRTHHDKEVEMGAVTIVARKLQLSLRTSNDHRERDSLCRLLNMIFRCSDGKATMSLQEVGVILLPVLVALSSDDDQSQPAPSNKAVQDVIARIAGLPLSLRRIKDQDILLVAFVRFLRQKGNAQAAALKILMGLTAHEDSKQTALFFPGLIDAVIEATGGKSPLECAKILNHLAWHTSNKAIMAKTPRLLSELEKLSRAKCKETSMHALRAFRSLSVEASTRKAVATLNHGRFLRFVVHRIEQSPCEEMMLVALSILSNLTCSKTSKQIASRPGVLSALVGIAMGSKVSSNAASAAARIVKNLAVHIGIKDSSHLSLMDALTAMTGSACSGTLVWTSRGLVEQTLKASSSFYMARTPKVMESILKLCNSSYPKVRGFALQAVANLTEDYSNARRMTSNGQVLRTLVDNVQIDDRENDEARRQAVRAILCLIGHKPSSRRIAKQFGLVPSLSRYATSDDDDVDLKRAALHGVLVLAPSM